MTSSVRCLAGELTFTDHRRLRATTLVADLGVGRWNHAQVYVGDRLDTDAIAAVEAGLRGVWLNRTEDDPHDYRGSDDPCRPSWPT